MVCIEPARIGQHPQQGAGQVVGLPAKYRARTFEGHSIGADADDGDGARTVAADETFQSSTAQAQFGRLEFVGCRRGTRDEIGDANPLGKDGAPLPRREPR